MSPYAWPNLDSPSSPYCHQAKGLQGQNWRAHSGIPENNDFYQMGQNHTTPQSRAHLRSGKQAPKEQDWHLKSRGLSSQLPDHRECREQKASVVNPMYQPQERRIALLTQPQSFTLDMSHPFSILTLTSHCGSGMSSVFKVYLRESKCHQGSTDNNEVQNIPQVPEVGSRVQQQSQVYHLKEIS